MNVRQSSFSLAPPGPGLERRPSVVSRLSSVFSNADQEAGSAARTGAGLIEEEIAEIKRYEDFTTIDWVQDAAREQAKRKARRKQAAGLYDKGQPGWRYQLWRSYDAAQAWIVVTIIGIAIGLNAALLNIITEWLSDVKMGYCETGFYLNENFCCWGEENGCDQWHRWTGFEPLNYFIYFVFATLFACVAGTLVKSFAPYAAGSGISEIKCIIAGFVMKGFLGWWTLIIKSVCLPLAIASGLSVGKEGPSVHYAVCTGNVISRLFDKYKRNASKTREFLSASAAAGVAVAFGSPIGGVLFSLEEMSNQFPLKTLWRSYFCALIATAVLAAMNPFRTGQLVMFQVEYKNDWHFFELLFYVLIGIFGGLYGAFVIKWNLRVQSFRKKYLKEYAVLEATLLAAGTAIIAYPNAFLRIDMTESMEILFSECGRGESYHGLCEPDKRWWNIISLFLATFLRLFLVILSYGCKVPAGIFVPSMAIGASFGRTIGILVQAIHEANPTSVFFSACKPDEPCITPGTYALLGAAAALSGIMHITISVVVIMFELTGALNYILPTMIVVGVTKAVSELFGKGGIADRMIWFSGMPFLDSKEEHNFGVPVSAVMRTSVVSMPAHGLTLGEVQSLLADDRYQGFPVVEDKHTKVLVGYIGSTELRYAIDKMSRTSPLSETAKCTFAPSSANLSSTSLNNIHGDSSHSSTLDFSRYVDATPVTAHPRLPLETVMELFQKIGPRVILIEYHGKLTGLVTVKDCLKYQFKVEAAENPKDDHRIEEGQEQLWALFQRAGNWFSGRVSRYSGGRIRLTSTSGGERPLGRGQILDGDEEVLDEGVELESRR
ncbi:chloride channel, other eukaryote [Fusarium oxysporum f. sp. lycopersici 4287]|uniref:Chloride channel protein n=4 Tax=Fusarium oxysporum TaxID=5507 RepID=A0A0J9UYB6_FUSO4|nr:chloride channel, other eukaryote [Fusarium oxysporum f. sp. lycopersici 4287]EXK35293.1 chloride channel, other eukaryote [Fusarium oxysporum f. sp. melonis 26406]KAJ9423574.1 chloride channel [Fusarium oxysporum]KNB04145.1 chloride channel, other eukaryote [Fusarium oxysporum f. sp. lycopersici 4287]